MPYADANRQRAANAEAQRRRRARGAVRPSHRRLAALPPARGSPRSRAASQRALDALLAQLDALEADGEIGTCERARTVALVCSAITRAAESADMAARLADVEAVLRAREPEPGPDAA